MPLLARFSLDATARVLRTRDSANIMETLLAEVYFRSFKSTSTTSKKLSHAKERSDPMLEEYKRIRS